MEYTPEEKEMLLAQCGAEPSKSSKLQQYLVIALLMINSLVLWVTFGIRSGFLIGSFEEHRIPSSMAGLIEGSMLLGYIFTFFSGLGSYLMKRLNSRILLAGNSGVVCILTLATGLVYNDHNNITVIIVSTGLRILQGCCSYLSYIFLFDTFSAQFSEAFDLAVAVNGLAGYAGMGLSVTIGCCLYDSVGYVLTFAIASVCCMVAAILMLFLPPTPTFLSTQKPVTEQPCPNGNSFTKSKSVDKLSLFVLVPLIASLSINLNFGYMQVTVTEYMHQVLGKSYSFGGLLFSLVTPGLVLGSMISGFVLQRRIVRANTQMMIGSVLMGTALLLTFPPPVMQYLAAYLAFPAVLMAGVGESLVTLAAITSMYDVQRNARGDVTPNCATRIAGLWVVGYAGFYFGGSGMAGAVQGLLTYNHMALVLVGDCVLSCIMCIVIRYARKHRLKRKEEQVPLLGI